MGAPGGRAGRARGCGGVLRGGKRPERAPIAEWILRANDRVSLPTADRAGAGERRGQGEKGGGLGAREAARLRRQRRDVRAWGVGVVVGRVGGDVGSYEVITPARMGVRLRRIIMVSRRGAFVDWRVLEAGHSRITLALPTPTLIATYLSSRRMWLSISSASAS